MLKGKIVHVDELKAVLVCVAAVVSCARTICKTRVIWIILNFRASLGFVASVLVALAGYGEYESGFRDIRTLRPVYQATKYVLYCSKNTLPGLKMVASKTECL